MNDTNHDDRAFGSWLALAAVNGFIAVAAGAFGAHALKDHLGANELAAFEVAARYQMYHALVLLVIAILQFLRPDRVFQIAGVCFLIGIVLFSGSLYGLTLLKWRWLVFVTPMGGFCMLFGWLALIVAGLSRQSSNVIKSS